MIQGYCTTNLDRAKGEEWPRHFACRPIVGDRVAAKSGRVLWVVSVQHELGMRGQPVLRVELHEMQWVPNGGS